MLPEASVVYHLQNVSGKSSLKVNETPLFGSFRWKMSGRNRTSEQVDLGHFPLNQIFLKFA